MIAAKISNKGSFTTMLEKRIGEWSAVRKLAVVIHTPPELNWWYYNEFGTATKREGMGSPTGYYEIPGSGTSIFMYKGVLHKRTAGKNPVHHPGTKASHAVSLAQPDYQNALKQAVRRGFSFGALNSPDKLLVSMHEGMVHAKELIARNYDSLLQNNDYHSPPGGTIGTGKLGGRKAADDYRALATVEDMKE